MILRSYPSLGVFPEVLVAVFLSGVLTCGTLVLWKVAHRSPVALIPDAAGVGEVWTAKPDRRYAESLARGFLLQWYLWTQNNQQYRRLQAVKLLSQEAQPRFRREVGSKGLMVEILAQASSIDIHSLSAQGVPGVPGAWRITFQATIRSYYGGMGGDPETLAGTMTLMGCQPTSQRPICLEINGITLTSALRRADQDALGELLVPLAGASVPRPMDADRTTGGGGAVP